MSKVNLSFKSVLTRISVLFIFLIPIESTLVNVALGDIAKAFPTADPTTISLISTLPTVISMIFVFIITPQLVKRFDKRSILLVALVIYIVGGVMPVVLNSSILHILVGRALLGLGIGLSAPLCGAIINELYSGMERENMMGWANGVGSIIGMGMSLAAGALCMIHWSYTFYAYLLFIVVVLLEFFFLPKMPVPVVKGADGMEKKAKIEYTSKQKAKLVCIYAWTFLATVLGMAVMLKVSITVTELGVGSAMAAGQAMAAMMIGMMLIDLVYGVIEKIIKRYVLVLMPLLVAIGFLLMAKSMTFSMFLVSSFIAGLGTGLGQPVETSRATAIGPRFNGGFAMSILMGSMMLGQFGSTYLEKLYGLFIEPTAANITFTSAILMFGFAAITLIYVVVNPFKGANAERVAGSVDIPPAVAS
jgi:MFS family permease